MLSTLRISLLLSVAAAAAACGGAPPAPASSTPATPTAPTDSSMPATTTPAASTGAPAAGGDSSVPATWSKDLTKPQQIAFMKAKVVPVMGPAFKGHDSTKYADFSCKTCHGPQYQTPKDFLPHLTFSGGTLTSFKDKPEISKFMHEVVVPQMAGVFGQPAYDPKTNTGFGCAGCHTVDKK